jgi:hypothetical protein
MAICSVEGKTSGSGGAHALVPHEAFSVRALFARARRAEPAKAARGGGRTQADGASGAAVAARASVPLKLAEFAESGVPPEAVEALVAKGVLVRLEPRGRRPAMFMSADLAASHGFVPGDAVARACAESMLATLARRGTATREIAGFARTASRPVWKREMLAAGFKSADIEWATGRGCLVRLRYGLYSHPECVAEPPPPWRPGTKGMRGRATAKAVAMATAASGPLPLSAFVEAGIPAQIPYYLTRRGHLSKVGTALFLAAKAA